MTTSLGSLIERGDKYRCIYADPPWPYANQVTRSATGLHYPSMSLHDIVALPIAALAHDSAHLHLWTTNAFLPYAFHVIEAWGFEYKSVLVWIKPTIGIGNYWRVSHEFLLLGVRGSCPFLDHGYRSWVERKRSAHSVKPIVIRKMVETVSPGPRLELFGRRVADGWTVWGNQIRKTLL